MSFVVKPHSVRAARIFVPIIDKRKPMPERSLGREFPFDAMQPGQSFFMRLSETTSYQRTLVRERIARYNKLYRVYYVIIKHEDEPKRLEVARIV